jgi:Zn-dependent protease
MGHFLTIIVSRRNLYGVHLRAASVVFETDIDNRMTELVCSAAGPFAGLLLVVFSPWIPRIAICAAVQSVYNLQPFPGFDGGRMLRSVLSAFLHEKTVERVSRTVAGCYVIISAGIIMYIGYLIHGGLCTLLLGGLLVWKSGLIKIPCKSGKPIVQ